MILCVTFDPDRKKFLTENLQFINVQDVYALEQLTLYSPFVIMFTTVFNNTTL